MLRKISLFLGAFAAVAVLSLGLVRISASPSRGKEAASARGIPWPAVIAHRGASALAPEHTAAAYETARDMGADYIEVDIQRTSDRVLVAVHDETLARTTNVAEIYPARRDSPVTTFTLAELKRLDAGGWFNRKYPAQARDGYRGLRVLTLGEIIGIAERRNPKPGLYIESKYPERSPGLEKDIVTALKSRGWEMNNAGRLIFQSFDIKSLERFRVYAPDAARVLLVSEEMSDETGLKKLFEQAAESGCGVGLVGYRGWAWNIGRAHRCNLVVHIYTVNAPAHFRLFSFFGADGFFTDRTGELMAYYGRRVPVSP
ncbi:MAG TPA: glycerophosphodiester phosphodiesterase [Spirochaetes bacterium]|nr:glycerophosphodiester phosphodiesterase [Spirochaetota bacterium]